MVASAGRQSGAGSGWRAPGSRRWTGVGGAGQDKAKPAGGSEDEGEAEPIRGKIHSRDCRRPIISWPPPKFVEAANPRSEQSRGADPRRVSNLGVGELQPSAASGRRRGLLGECWPAPVELLFGTPRVEEVTFGGMS